MSQTEGSSLWGGAQLRNPGEPEIVLLPGDPGLSWSDRHAFLGVMMRNVDGKIAAALGVPGAAGVLIVDVVKGSPAMEAGFQAGDVILTMDKKAYKDMQQLREAIMKRSPGDEVTFGVLRKGQVEELKAKLGAKKKEAKE